MARHSSLNVLNVFTEDEIDFFNEDIFTYIHKHIFNSKNNDELDIKDISEFFMHPDKIEKALLQLELTMYELIYYSAKYFNINARVTYHPLALAKKIKSQIENFEFSDDTC